LPLAPILLRGRFSFGNNNSYNVNKELAVLTSGPIKPKRPSPLYAEGHFPGFARPPGFGVLNSENAPTGILRGLKNNGGWGVGVGGNETTPPKSHKCWPTDAKKKKSGLSRRKLSSFFSEVPSFPLPTDFRKKHHPIYKARRTPFRLVLFLLGLFLTRVASLLLWTPFSAKQTAKSPLAPSWSCTT
jgi:hypothetical protein